MWWLIIRGIHQDLLSMNWVYLDCTFQPHGAKHVNFSLLCLEKCIRKWMKRRKWWKSTIFHLIETSLPLKWCNRRWNGRVFLSRIELGVNGWWTTFNWDISPLWLYSIKGAKWSLEMEWRKSKNMESKWEHCGWRK